LYVLKFGGTSVGSTARIRSVAGIIANFVNAGDKVIVVTSAMHGVTNKLIESAKPFYNSDVGREYDAVISSGEQIAAGLLSMCLCSQGIKAISMNCWQIPITATGRFSEADIKSIKKESIMAALDRGTIPVITGFQGMSSSGEIMTIGRGGSDATAVAVSYAVNADECLIYTDVDGVYTADPRVVLNSHRLSRISYDEMLELAEGGAKVLQPRSVLLARLCKIKLRVLSSFTDTGGTVMTDSTAYIPNDRKITGISHNTNLVRAIIFGDINKNIKVVLDKIMHIKMFSITDGIASFLFQKSEINSVKHVLENEIGNSFEIDNDIGVLTIVGDWTNLNNESSLKVFQTLYENSIAIKQTFTSTSALYIVTQLQCTEHALNVLHSKLFDQDLV
jgi:aspartate kinase